ncbi:MAG: hypothetical protein VXW38_12670 [Bacteroidota bacterium]|nr:hypothetical protein [Bacteroidota bacterium]
MGTRTGIIALIFLISSCAAHKNSEQSKGEKIVIELNENKNKAAGAEIGGILLAAAPYFIDWGYKGLQTLFDREQKKYVATYKSKKKDENFYHKISPQGEVTLNYSGFAIYRLLDKETDLTKAVSKISFEFVPNSSGSMLSLVPKEIFVNRSKAKILKSDTDIDLIVKISIKSKWLAEGVFNSKELLNSEFTFKNIKIQPEDKNDRFIYKVITDKSQELKELEVYCEPSERFSYVPYSTNKDGDLIRDSGLNVIEKGYFIIETEVIESDDYKKRIEKTSKKIQNSKDLLKEIFKTVTSE